jgi:hypothetical protein
MDLSPPAATSGSSGSTSYCVRLCDGRFFPMSGDAASSPAAAASMCAAMCPAARTAIYHGAAVADATATNGKPCGNLGHAFVYRQTAVPGCTCDSRNPFGLARSTCPGIRHCAREASSRDRLALRSSGSRPAGLAAMRISHRSTVPQAYRPNSAAGSPPCASRREGDTSCEIIYLAIVGRLQRRVMQIIYHVLWRSKDPPTVL